MTWTQTTINIKDASGTNQPFIAYTDGTNFSFAHPILDNTGAIVAPATSGNQTTGNTSLATIATNSANIPAKGSATSANSTPVVIASDQAALPLPTGAATATNQATANTSLASIVTNTGNIPAKGSAASANSTPVVIASDQAALPLPTGAATSANQTTANTSLATIATAIQAATPAGANVIGGVTVADGSDTTVGAKADAAASTDTGTFSLIALFKRLLSSTTTLITACQAATPAGTNIIGKFTTDQTTHGTSDLVAADITKVAGSAISQGHGTAATAIRVELPTDGTGVVGLIAGTALVGKVGIDQTTPGTTNGVQVTAALPAGTNLIGKFGIDQTTPATTNLVQVADAGLITLTASPTTTAGAYTTGMVCGGLLTLTSAYRASGGSGYVINGLIGVKTALTAPFDVLIFDTNPSNSTFTDNSALAINTADLPSLAGTLHCTDLISGGTPQVLQSSDRPIACKNGSSNTSLYAVIVMRGAETLTTTSLNLVLKFKQN